MLTVKGGGIRQQTKERKKVKIVEDVDWQKREKRKKEEN